MCKSKKIVYSTFCGSVTEHEFVSETPKTYRVKYHHCDATRLVYKSKRHTGSRGGVVFNIEFSSLDKHLVLQYCNAQLLSYLNWIESHQKKLKNLNLKLHAVIHS